MLMERTPFKTDLDSLKKKIDKIKSNKKENSVQSFRVHNDGWRMVIELVVGMLIGFRLAGRITDMFVTDSGHDWTQIWTYPAIFAAIVLVIFILTFKNEKIEIEK